MEIADIRRKALAAIVDRDGLSTVAKKVGKPDRQINDMLAGRKSFGEKVARAIESSYAPDLPPGWLDTEDKPQRIATAAPDVNVAPGPAISHAEQALLDAYRATDAAGKKAIDLIARRIMAWQKQGVAETGDFAGPAPKTVSNPDIPALKGK